MNINNPFLLIISTAFVLVSCSNGSDNKSQPQKDTVIVKPIETPVVSTIPLDSISQLDDKEIYLDCLNPKYFLKKKVRKNEYGKKELVYLGVITNEIKDTLYYVITEYKELKLAITTRGSSFLYYFSHDKQFYKQYDPDVMPFKLENNQFLFNQVDAENKKYVYANKAGIEVPDYIQCQPE